MHDTDQIVWTGILHVKSKLPMSQNTFVSKIMFDK